MKVTQKDIAHKLGVSTSLVSRVLSGQAHRIGVSQRRIDSILKLAEEMNYVPSPAALMLKGKNTQTIGIVVYDFHKPYFTALLTEFQKLAHENKYSLLVVGFPDRTPDNSNLIPLYKHSVDGIIVLGSFCDLDWIDDFKNKPIARIGHGERDARLWLSVSVDERDAMRKILRHVRDEVKAESVCFAYKPMKIYEQRKDAFESVAAETDLSVSFAAESEGANEFETGRILGARISQASPRPDAVVCANDTFAMGVISALSDADIKAGRDISVVGFDDIPASAHYTPTISSFRQPLEEYAKLCFQSIMIEKSAPDLNLKGKFIPRQSSNLELKRAES